ncbi:hypothetical protein LZ32DRAFT_625414 [Colletotrichum eremochloae]|uniref:Uncharacterized protein n=1 Tax=Colletotrichum sublineola TaxID=1173701 RepID=A0A066XWD0_COLSU|nr:hypothetical protein LY78DRAFT_326326 [Colletotrichum sublineola]KAK2017855.1 hypothetical protein LZ32DRAFT_625414 [Colletotrichum eremochloae]KDN70240.1 hypothetical protein CSUB01_03470 [Colletotrichum sublineola]
MPQTPISPPWRDSWPPTLVRLAPTTPKEYPSLDDIDEDPLTYFLTPAPDLEDHDEDVNMMNFDAGIEDNSPREIVRSVSPSTLDGLSKAKGGRKSPPVPGLSDLATPDTDEEEEDYIRFAPQGFTVPFSLRDFAIDGVKSKVRSKSSGALLSPSSFSPGRGKATVRPGGRGRQRSVSFRHQRPQHVWREPSPDVWSIEEETEEELVSEMGSSTDAVSDIGDMEDVLETRMNKDVEAAKPRKKVRFLLPAME